MRKWLRFIRIGSAALLLMATGPSWAAPGREPGANPNAPGQIRQNPPAAPEIDIGAGGAAITVLVIALLLAAEKRARAA